MVYSKRIFGLAAVGLMVLAGTLKTAEAQSVQIGYTDPNLIVAQMPEYEEILSQMQSMYQGGQQEYQQMVKEYQSQLQDYQKKQSLMSEDVRQKREKELQQRQQKIQQFLSQKQQEMGETEQELMQPLLEKVDGAIQEVAAEQNLDLVLSTQAANSSVVLYASDNTVDITEPVMRNLGLDPQAPQSVQPGTTPPSDGAPNQRPSIAPNR
jgi:outer membrane protein